jgi:ABC-type multidrug transport system fused ATPase/permease subunit
VYLLQGPVADIGELVAEWQKGFASVNRIAEITNLSNKNPLSKEATEFLIQDTNHLNMNLTSNINPKSSMGERAVLEVNGLKTLVCVPVIG